MTAILAVALAAGMVATVNPCGFVMLPAYLGFFLSADGRRPNARVARVALAISGGFLAVFGLAGTVIAFGLRAVVSVIPWLALAVGIGLMLLGVNQVRGKRMLPYLPGPARFRRDSSTGGMFVFGLVYAVASLSCTLPIFLSLIGTAVAASSGFEALLIFLSYGLGMALVVSGVTVVIGSGRHSVVDRMRSLGRRLDLFSGWLMLLAGAFVVWYWATALWIGPLALGFNPLVRWIDKLSSSITGLISRNVVVVAAGLAALFGIGWAMDRRRRRVT